MKRLGLYGFVYVWFFLLILLPVLGLIVGAFQSGVSGFLQALTQPEALSSLKLTFEITLLTVLINAVFGVMTALMIARRSTRGWQIINAIVDLPFAVSPVIAGLALILVYGPKTFIGGAFEDMHIHIIFAMPGMVIATLFVTFPFVVRELVPILREKGEAEEEAALTLGASRWRVFWTVTLPGIKWSLIYGMVLTLARALGEFGAVLVVSGGVIMLTQTATLYVYQATVNSDMQAAYSVALLLAATSFVILMILQLVKRREGRQMA
ncbi:sulfate ABC transporter permease subunit [Alicyclobacillus cycloheptanicus]|uniref:Sulfate transport system permease protein n=1 Tax=Alicyclobacillus cycloheptanicus TaxID=1457 RepID=A0ABT9XH23_9BACL|nr:sulfate ABC transporter permease subunit [Alicyclobacillus cycloheptanicus]MDQ0189583.1 sulfate transport system permease protein [Alicyclobacillus cycloheptanicus]WDL99894.1 sulfate ABC transporter permease subunit [Alicyclobacillus cycloheptanicus]